MIELKKSNVHGLGAFATKKIRKGQVIAKYPFIFVEHKKDESLGEADDYIFEHTDTKSIILLGDGSFFNHNEKANVIYKIGEREKFIYFIAKKTILPFEECFINYGRGYWSSRKNT